MTFSRNKNILFSYFYSSMMIHHLSQELQKHSKFPFFDNALNIDSHCNSCVWLWIMIVDTPVSAHPTPGCSRGHHWSLSNRRSQHQQPQKLKFSAHQFRPSSTHRCPSKKKSKYHHWFLRDRPWEQGSWSQHGAHLGPKGPRWAPCWPHELCYLGDFAICISA